MLQPWQAATIGALVTTWATFVPCFLMIFVSAPHVESIRSSPRLGAALTAITAAVVGVILNLTIWFSWHALWPHGWQSNSSMFGIDVFLAVVGVGAFFAMEHFRFGLIPTIAVCAVLGLLWRQIIG